jgi:hypothetical protein
MTHSSPQRDVHTSARAAMQSRHPMAIGRIEKATDARTALRRLVAYLLPFRTGLIGVFVLVVIYTLLGLLGPVFDRCGNR